VRRKGTMNQLLYGATVVLIISNLKYTHSGCMHFVRLFIPN
jgi:hypothetical protein